MWGYVHTTLRDMGGLLSIQGLGLGALETRDSKMAQCVPHKARTWEQNNADVPWLGSR